jgi:CRP-like cAMP-binding protein
VRPLAGQAGEQLALAVLEPYSIFGEMSFFHKAPHSASVRAQTSVELLCIARGDYDDLIREGAWGAYKLAFNAVASLAERLRRMDEWVAELAGEPARAISSTEGRSSEWADFRDRMFARWNL